MMDLAHKSMLNMKPAGKWDEAYPSGNGIQGVLVMGEPLDETIIFNHERLFLPLPVNEASVIPDMSGELPALREMIRRGRYQKATRFYLDKLSEKGFPSELLWTDPFHPAFELRIKTDKAGETADYRRWLDFETGEACVRWRDERGAFERHVLVSRKCDAVVIRLDAPSEGDPDCEIYLAERAGREHIKAVAINAGTITDFIEQEPEQLDHTDDVWFMFNSRYEVGNGGYCGMVRIHAPGSSVEFHDGRARVHDFGGAIIVARTIPYKDHNLFSPSAAMAELAALSMDYDRFLKEHAIVHGELFDRMRLDLYDEEGAAAKDRSKEDTSGAYKTTFTQDRYKALDNEELMNQACKGNISPAFIERMHDFGRYLLISSSG